MPVEMKLWKINGGKLSPVKSEALESEAMLEDWLVHDISMVSDDLLVIGQQLSSPLGGTLDLLAIDGNGDLAVLELKRDRTPRDVMAQALHYAAWVRRLAPDEIHEIATKYFGGDSLEAKFNGRFGQDLPDTLNTTHRIYIVAAEMDLVSETIVNYLSEEGSLNINVVFFRHFRDNEGREFLARSWLVDPTEVEGRTAGGKRRPTLTLEKLAEQAEEHGVNEQYQSLYEFFSPQASIARTQSNIAFRFHVEEGGIWAAFSVYPGKSSPEKGLYTDVRPELLAKAFKVSEDSVRHALPGSGTEHKYAYGEIYYFRTEADVDNLKRVLSVRNDEREDTEEPSATLAG